jgi:hypothetical protein
LTGCIGEWSNCIQGISGWNGLVFILHEFQ